MSPHYRNSRMRRKHFFPGSENPTFVLGPPVEVMKDTIRTSLVIVADSR
jgi:hypothetical protein